MNVLNLHSHSDVIKRRSPLSIVWYFRKMDKEEYGYPLPDLRTNSVLQMSGYFFSCIGIAAQDVRT